MESILKEIEVIYRNPIKVSESIHIKTSVDVERLLRKVWSDNMDFCESAYLLCLNRANRVIGWTKLSQGGLAGTVIDLKHVFSIALKANSAGIIISHCHPSGNLRPSDQDIQLTKNIIKVGGFLELPLLDHIILTSESYFSFGDEGLL